VGRDTVGKTALLCNRNGLPIASNFPRPLRARSRPDHSTMHRYPGTPVSPHVRLSVPRLAHASRSWCMVLVAEEITTFAVQKRMFSRAAGVSPPWFGLALATATGFCGPITFRPAQSLRVPRLAHASRSWVHSRLLLQNCDTRQRVASRTTAGLRQPLLVHARKSSQMGGGALQRRFVSHGGLTPPALGFVCGRRCRCGLTADESVSFSHGWLTPAALVSGRECLPAKDDFFDAQTHIRPRAAGVSPPWVGLALATAIGFCGLITFRPARSFPVPRLAYASRSWVHARKSSQMGGGALQRRFVSHGGLTPPALVLRCERPPAKNDIFDAQTHIRLRAAGVSPPWVALRRADSARRITSGE
jgi:hypothetical protein